MCKDGMPIATFRDTPSKGRDDPSSIDFEFRFVASELEKKCHEYDRIADTKTTDTTNETWKGDEKNL